jgi:5-methylcytosine-specific restriction endonuclease McrA
MAISQARRMAVFERDGHRCLKCGCRTGLTVDHIRAKADGGTDELENLQTLCEDCNQQKGDAYEDLRRR